jgi:hypothetical protein
MCLNRKVRHILLKAYNASKTVYFVRSEIVSVSKKVLIFYKRDLSFVPLALFAIGIIIVD